MSGLDNANPTVHTLSSKAKANDIFASSDAAWDSDDSSGDEETEMIDANEIYDLIRSISDPEHPLTLEQLAVVNPEHITVQHGAKSKVLIEFTPTIPHCSMATLIGLSIRVRMLRSLPERFKVDIRVRKGSHQSENAVNRQLNDKERVCAAMENKHLLEVVEGCLKTAHLRGLPNPEQ